MSEDCGRSGAQHIVDVVFVEALTAFIAFLGMLLEMVSGSARD
jgi:hypothetical protein